MKKTKLFTSIAALALVLGLGACETTSEEETTPDESEGTTETTGTTTEGGGTTEGGEGGETTPAPEEGTYFLGFDVDGTVNYIDGGLVGNYSYEGSVTTNIGLAVPVTLAAADGDDAYYLTFDLDEVTYYICIITLDGGYVDLQYTTEANAIYWDESHAAWVNEEDTYFLCYNSSYSCAYASDFDTWWGKSPVGELFDIPEDWEPYVPTVPEGDTYKLGALDSTNYCYRYFSGSTTGSTFLATTTDWDQAANVYITAVDDEIENSCTLSFIDANGSTKYISNNNSTSVTLADDPCVWVWVDSLEIFAQGSSSGRALVLYTDGSLRGYAQNDTNLAYPHVHAYTEAQENPEAPEVTTSYEQVSSLGDGGEYYIGGTYESNFYLTTGQLVSSYNLACTTDLDSAVPFTVTGNNTDGWTLTNSEGKYVYMYKATNGYVDFGLSDASTVPNSGTKTFLWSDAATTLYTSEVQRTYNGTTYTYSYFEFYQGYVAAYGTDTLSASTSNLAHFYQAVAD